MKTDLKLPPIDARIRPGEGGREEIFDPLRKRYVALTPEEWVRQHMIGFLLDHLGYPGSLTKVEAALKYNRLKKRADIVVHRKDGKPGLIVECKAPNVELTSDVLRQAAMYCMPLQVRFLVITNGLQTFVLQVDPRSGKAEFRDDMPRYDEL
jgi:predicted type IV restriction endonuclease